MISSTRVIGSPACCMAAMIAPTSAPADDPATRANVHPASSRAVAAPTRAIPLTPPPSSTRSAVRVVGGVMGRLYEIDVRMGLRQWTIAGRDHLACRARPLLRHRQ